jgi:hypothetical protein
MYDRDVRHRALALIEGGQSLRSISKSTGNSRATLSDWRDHPERRGKRAVCPRCGESPRLPESPRDYAYLLGLYLGDGCISVAGNPAKGVWALRIACADAWPGLQAECKRAMSVSWRFSRRNTISVARREAVARLDEFVGPKY